MRIFATSAPTARATPENLMEDMEAEVAMGKAFYNDRLILQAWMDETYTRTFMILEADSVAAAKARFEAYPQVQAGVIAFSFTPIIGMPAVRMAHEERGEATLPAWWPPG